MAANKPAGAENNSGAVTSKPAGSEGYRGVAADEPAGPECGIKRAAAKTLHLGKLSTINKLPRPRIEGTRESRVDVDTKTVKSELASKWVTRKISFVEYIYTCVRKPKFG